jgi:hypothetical protein
MSVAAASKGGRALAVLGRCARAPFRALLRARDLYVRQMTTFAGGRGPVGMVSVPRSRSNAFYRSADDDADVRELIRAASRARPPGAAPRSQSVAIGRIDEDTSCEFGTDGGAMVHALGLRSRSCAVGSTAKTTHRRCRLTPTALTARGSLYKTDAPTTLSVNRNLRS